MIQVNELRYKRFAWCKSFRLDELPEGTQSQDQETLLECIVDFLLCGEMKKSSNFAELDAGPWEICSQAEAHRLAGQIHTKMGCSSSEKALAHFLTLKGHFYSLQHDYVYATAVLNEELCAFFFDAG